MTTQEYTLEQDIKVCAVTATSFPAGIQEAFQKLGAIAPQGSKMWGLSRPEQGGGIVYKAAAEINGDAPTGCETIVIRKGKYIGMAIHDFMKNTQQIGAAFQMLLHNPGIDPNGYCVERYTSDKDVICMVRLND